MSVYGTRLIIRFTKIKSEHATSSLMRLQLCMQLLGYIKVLWPYIRVLRPFALNGLYRLKTESNKVFVPIPVRVLHKNE
jgi:hypothetical protein